MRGAVVILRDGQVAMIRRDHLNEDPYYLFPGGVSRKGRLRSRLRSGRRMRRLACAFG